MLIQFGMRAGAVEDYFSGRFFNTVDKKPVRFNMTFPLPFVISFQRMIFMFRQKRLFVNKHTHNLDKVSHILALLFYKLSNLILVRLYNRTLKSNMNSVHAVFLELTGKNWIQHCLVVSIQIYKHFFKRIVSFCRYLTP